MAPLLPASPKVPVTPPSSPDDAAFDTTPSSSASSDDGGFAESVVRMALGDDYTEAKLPISVSTLRKQQSYLSTRPRFHDLAADILETLSRHVIQEKNQNFRFQDKNLDGIFNTWVYERQLSFNSHHPYHCEATGSMDITPFFDRVKLLKLKVIVDPKVFAKKEIGEGIYRELLRFPRVRVLEVNVEVPDVQRVIEDGTARGLREDCLALVGLRQYWRRLERVEFGIVKGLDPEERVWFYGRNERCDRPFGR